MFIITGGTGVKPSSNMREFTLDTPDDVDLLPTQEKKGKNIKYTVENQPCATGSSAFVISTGQLFMLNSEGIWCEV